MNNVAKRWQASFYGRRKNAIGIFYNITAEVEADTEKEAELELYNEYDHISGLRLKEAP